MVEQIWINSHFWFAQSSVWGVENEGIFTGFETIYAIYYP